MAQKNTTLKKIETIRKVSDHFMRTTIMFSVILFFNLAYQHYRRPELLIILFLYLLALFVKGITFGLKAVIKNEDMAD